MDIRLLPALAWRKLARIISVVKSVSGQLGRCMAQVALAAALSNRRVIPIVGARKVFQLQDDIASFDLALFR